MYAEATMTMAEMTALQLFVEERETKYTEGKYQVRRSLHIFGN